VNRRVPGRTLGRAATAVSVAVVALLALAGPVAADPPAPTDYRSVVDAVEPAAEGVDVHVVGGDSFLHLDVRDGHEVLVEGYEGEPYLRFRADGTVERNRRSPATYVNEDRQGEVDMPAGVDAEAEPDWEQVASGGSYAWHDHRIHWMNPSRPPGGAGQVVQEWTVGLTVDGRPTSIDGRLLWVDGVSPWPWLALGVAVSVALVVVGIRRTQLTLVGAGVATVVGAGLALVAGGAQYADAPVQGAANPLLVAVPLAALLAGGAGLALGLRARGRGALASAAPVALLAGVAAVLGWGLLRLEVLWKPVLPTGLPYGVDRAATTLAMALVVAAAGLVVQGGGLAVARVSAGEAEPTEADPDAEPEPERTAQ
jgi:hypothetical protein